MELNLKGVATAFVETELGRLETELKSLHAQLHPLSTSDEIQLLSALKAALGDDASSNNNNNRSGWAWELFDWVPPTLDAIVQNSGGKNPLDRYTSGLLLQLKLKFLIQMKDCIIISNKPATTTAEGQEKEDIHGTPTPAAADETHELPIPFGINDLMPSESERQERRQNYMKSKHKEVKEETESQLKLVLELSNVSTEEKADFIRRFRILLERILEKVLWPKEDEQWKLGEGTRKRPHLNREEEDERKNSHKKKLPAVAEAGRDDYIKGEMNRLAREYERLMKQHLAAYVEFPSMSSHPSSVSGAPPQLVDPPPPPPVSIVIQLGWNLTHVGWIPPNKTTIELLFPPIPCLIGLSEDETEVLYGAQIWKAVKKQLRLPEETEAEGGTEVVSSSTWLNLKSMLADKEVEWRKGKDKVRSELPLAIFLIHVKTKIEAAIPPPSSATKYKVILVLPQVLSIVQRGRISDAAKLAGFDEDQVHLIKETTAAALAYAHDTNSWNPESMLPVLVFSSPEVLDSNADENNADIAIFSNTDGVVSMEKCAGRQGLLQNELLQEMTKFKKVFIRLEGKMNRNSVLIHLDDGNYEEVPCSQEDEMQDFRAHLLHLQKCMKRKPASENGDRIELLLLFLNKVNEHLTKSTVRYLHSF
jgi:hypothetical protein